jgi:hypothetical protein
MMSLGANIKLVAIVAGVIGATLALGCARYDGITDGAAVAAADSRQTQNPERSEERTPVEGIGATTAADVTTNYHANQATTAQQQRQDRQRDNGLVDIR